MTWGTGTATRPLFDAANPRVVTAAGRKTTCTRCHAGKPEITAGHRITPTTRNREDGASL